MNGFKLLAVGAFLCSGTSFCHAQISILEGPSEPRSILVGSSEDRFAPTPASDLTRQNVQAEITESPSNESLVNSASDLLIDAHVTPTKSPDPTSLPVAHGQPNVIDQILRNGLIAQTPHSAQVPIAWPMQQVDNPTARMMSGVGCTQGLWDTYSSERAAECARMYQNLAKSRQAHGCGLNGHCSQCNAGCASGACAGPARPVNRYAPASCGSPACGIAAANTISQPANQPQFRSLLAPEPSIAQPLNDAAQNGEVAESKDNVAQIPGLIR